MDTEKRLSWRTHENNLGNRHGKHS